MPHIVAIHRVLAKRGPAESLPEAEVVAQHGITGDYRSGQKRGRHLTLIEAEAITKVADQLQIEVPLCASRRQIVVEGIRLNELIGQRLRLGPVLAEIQDFCHPCERMETAVGCGAKSAMAGLAGVCARVIEGGVLRPGDEVIADCRLWMAD
jgi:MOSC domain-containing protein YiiM